MSVLALAVCVAASSAPGHAVGVAKGGRGARGAGAGAIDEVSDTHTAPRADPRTHARRVAAMVGGVVADAAAGPLFWIYDVNEIDRILKAAVRVPLHALEQPSVCPTMACSACLPSPSCSKKARLSHHARYELE
jgi:hypothetical protein